MKKKSTKKTAPQPSQNTYNRDVLTMYAIAIQNARRISAKYSENEKNGNSQEKNNS